MPLRLDELFDLLRIESISSDGEHAAELRLAADWVAAMAGGGTVVEGFGNPLVDALIPASVADAPTVVAYGHYDVQAPGDPALWTTPAFDPQVRDGWLYARGASDDKGNYWALLRAALDLAENGNLGVNVRVIADGEEEIGGHSVIDYLATLEDDFGAAVIFDGGMASADVPAVTTALRGLAGFQVRLITNRRELHSGLYGGAAANPVHDLVTVLAAVAGHDQDFSAGIAPVTDEERAGWASLPSCAELMRAAGATPADDRAEADFYSRTWEGPSLTVHSIGCGDPRIHKTSIGTDALASLSLRVAPGQDPAALQEQLERRLRSACPAHATIELEAWPAASPAYISPTDPVIVSSFDAIERATGTRPLAMRSGGSIPLMAALVSRGTPTILSGFTTSDDDIHSPNEKMRVRNLEWAFAAGREIFQGLATALRDRR